jgi:hypothetical protein
MEHNIIDFCYILVAAGAVISLIIFSRKSRKKWEKIQRILDALLMPKVVILDAGEFFVYNDMARKEKMIENNQINLLCREDYDADYEKYNRASVHNTLCAIVTCYYFAGSVEKRAAISLAAETWINHLNKFIRNPQVLLDLISIIEFLSEEGIIYYREYEHLLFILHSKTEA